MIPSMNWPFPQIDSLFYDPETEKYARWFFTHFSSSAVEILRETIWIFYIKNNTWLNPSIARLFGFHIEQMQCLIQDAINRGALKVDTVRNVKERDYAAVIGAYMCEMLDKRQLTGTHLYKVVEIHQRATRAAS